MRTLLILAALILVSSVASGQNVTDCYNGFGIYLKPDPPMLTNYTEYDGPTGTVTAYLLLLNPYNEHTGEPIVNLGGYEFQLVFPDHLQVSFALHGDATNYMLPPDFFVGLGAGMPVTDRQALLITIYIEAPTDEAAFWYMREITDCGWWPCPLEILVTDADDDFTISQATPVTYSFEAPLFCMFAPCDDAPGGFSPGGTGGVWGDCWVVPTARRSWGDIKAMYR